MSVEKDRDVVPKNKSGCRQSFLFPIGKVGITIKFPVFVEMVTVRSTT